MNRFLTNKKMIMLLITVLIFISLITFSLSSRGGNIVQSGANDVTGVVGRLLSKPTNAIFGVVDSVNDVQSTYEENQRLKGQLDAIHEKEAAIATLKSENQQLKDELGLEELVTEYTVRRGNVISRNPDQWINQVIIDLGTMNGMERGMPVMNNNGLVGYISETNPTSSKVTLISNVDLSASKVSSEIILDEEEEAIQGIISEYKADTNQLVMSQITSDVEIKPGTLVTTSGLGGAFPRGLVIGEVEAVRLDEQGLERLVFIKPLSDFNNIRIVSVIERSAETVFSAQKNPSEQTDETTDTSVNDQATPEQDQSAESEDQ
ncbi:rod shape-determining protein MreC [Dolosigranulum pigrum]|uniref:rod shape-determining protein MreC n=1 Tax=Dolosigranulum pigrum TaxID=29394 RepID=UPI000DBFE9B3|nr:rod shape-determining protein MreC [Dolosigranulum pigrum]DAX48008.1 MAG TPA: rod shape determining protein [Caudoviricetes sp.]QTJ50452.1 rod shape-determining protein MreC [Dolosigranulum pigrum]QTJ52166.1 rod shape-determining protein MreC [Dolosigranulum pigrum]QTJ55114.1 rod shape-determining protein MreC [Dolosigranulum pigrum]QTJ60568.1 rod shape-determining protein MreC [Dolosigranulum pigrum]